MTSSKCSLIALCLCFGLLSAQLLPTAAVANAVTNTLGSLLNAATTQGASANLQASSNGAALSTGLLGNNIGITASSPLVSTATGLAGTAVNTVEQAAAALPVNQVLSALPVNQVLSTAEQVATSLPVGQVLSALPVGQLLNALPTANANAAGSANILGQQVNASGALAN